MIGTFSSHRGVVAGKVEVTIAPDHRRLDQSEGWRGEAWLPIDSQVLPGDTLTLEMGDGHSGSVLIERVTVDSKAGQMLIRFTSIGPMEGDGNLPLR